MRRAAILTVLAMLLLVPAIALAQGTASDIVELVFTDGGAQVGITDTIESVAAVTVEIDGQQYLLKVPVTIDIDTAVPLTSSLLSVPAAARVGQLGIEILAAEEFTEETEVAFPGFWGGEKDLAPSSDDSKLVVVSFDITNCGNEQASLSSYNVQGVDDTGRRFEELEFSCEDVNPGETGHCVSVFDLATDVNIIALDIEVTDHRQLPVPR
ncbi:MAG: hypothetical protein HPY83_13185 [Anaerolineae bacterium]|nr:hypothetical protein [Anaerolineae bacterium]